MPKKKKNKLPPLNIGNGTIGQRIALFRKNKGLTQKELAKQIGITNNLVSDYETGRLHLSDEMVLRFAIALGVSTDEILGLKSIIKNNKISLKIMKRVLKIEKLTHSQQKLILRNIDLNLLGIEKELSKK